MKEDREDRGHTESNSSLKLELLLIGLGLNLRMCLTMYSFKSTIKEKCPKELVFYTLEYNDSAAGIEGDLGTKT
jgi:hypothetical protein